MTDYVKFTNPNESAVAVLYAGRQLERLGRHDAVIKPVLEEPYQLQVVSGQVAKVVVTDMPEGIEADQWIVDVGHRKPVTVVIRTNEDLKKPATSNADQA